MLVLDEGNKKRKVRLSKKLREESDERGNEIFVRLMKKSVKGFS